jgi:hypothetical protein
MTNGAHAAHVTARRTLTESRLSQLLKEAGSTAHFYAISNLVFEYHPRSFETYLAQLFSLFNSLPNPIDTDILLPVMQDAWNYFPHRSLDGKCPIELFLKLHPDGLERLELEAKQ